MATYVDGFVLVMKKENLPAYKKMAKEGKEAWLKFGALDYKECVGDDLTPPQVTRTFPKLVNAKPDEVVVFSYITFKSKADRNKVNKQVMAFFDKKYEGKDQTMPFDMRRMSYGGFTTIVE